MTRPEPGPIGGLVTDAEALARSWGTPDRAYEALLAAIGVLAHKGGDYTTIARRLRESATQLETHHHRQLTLTHHAQGRA